jgi:hypothetical protein
MPAKHPVALSTLLPYNGCGLQYTNILKVFMKQIPFWTVIKQTKRKYILHPYKANMVQKLYDENRQARHNFMKWYLLCVYDGEIDPTLF